MSIEIVTVPQHDPRLGRFQEHHDASRAFALLSTIDRSSWGDKAVRLYDPLPNPFQVIGNCTGCAKAMEFNAVGNRITGFVKRMADADRLYSWASYNDQWPGGWPPEDTGSSGIAVAKAAVASGEGGVYEWEFRGADGIVQNIQEGRVMSIGTWWYEGMFNPDSKGQIRPTGMKAGGHQYIARGYDESTDRVLIRCWWGSFRDAWISRTDLDALVRDGGDAHSQRRGVVG